MRGPDAGKAFGNRDGGSQVVVGWFSAKPLAAPACRLLVDNMALPMTPCVI